jgi:hypothetical protein
VVVVIDDGKILRIPMKEPLGKFIFQ